MNNVEWGFKKRKVNFDDEVENTQYARIQKLNTSDGMPTGFFHPTDDRRLMTVICIKHTMTQKLLQ